MVIAPIDTVSFLLCCGIADNRQGEGDCHFVMVLRVCTGSLGGYGQAVKTCKRALRLVLVFAPRRVGGPANLTNRIRPPLYSALQMG